MKKLLKIFFVVFSVVFIFNGAVKVLAGPVEEPVEFERLSTERLNSYCPESGDPNLVSICGSVRQATAQPQVLSDGSTAPAVSQVPVKGVSVYLYECDNASRTCKRDGLLSHPFSSTSTNKDGVFHLVGRKLENNWTYEYKDQILGGKDLKKVNITNQGKKSYLVFKCGNYFQGIHIIPSYMDLPEVIHEVNCPEEYLTEGEKEFSYVPPLLQFDFIGGVKLAAQMGIEEDGYYPVQAAERKESHEEKKGDETYTVYDGVRSAVQAHYENYANLKNQSVPIILKGADPRFTSPSHDAGKERAIASALIPLVVDLNPSNTSPSVIAGILSGIYEDTLSKVVPTEGAWYYEDCKLIYKGTKWESLCRTGDYQEELYNFSDLTTQVLLPSLPPTQSLLYFRPLEIRNEISAYYQDQDDLAKFLGSAFSNCVGDVYKREWESTPEDEEKPTYPDCELLKLCNKTVSYDKNISSLTANGPAQSMMSPGALKNLEDEAIPDTPVCFITGEEEPVLLKQIQRPGQLVCQEYDPATKKGMRLCDGGAYWNNYYLTNLGNNNNALKWGLAGENEEDSYYRNTDEGGELLKDGSDINSIPFQRGSEGKGSPEVGGQGAVASSGDRSGNNSGKAVLEITSGSAASSTEALTDFIAQPFKDDKIREEISEGVPYYISSRPVAWGQFSKTNSHPEQMITSGSQDNEYLDPYAFNTEMECEQCAKEHYPDDLKEGNIEIKLGREGGSRTPFEGITVSTAAANRMSALQNDTGFWENMYYKGVESLDSAISISTGHSYIDWPMLKVKGKPPIETAFSTIMNSLFSWLFGGSGNRKENKTFTDRVPTGLGEDFQGDNFKVNDELIAYGFEINASNFETYFGCPGSKWPGSWGGDGGTGCYPWNPVPSGSSCNTADTCGGLSRTCRVDVCDKGNVHITYKCGLDGTTDVLKRDIVSTGNCTVIDTCAYEQTNGGINPHNITPACGPSDSSPTLEITVPYDYCTVSRAGPNECDGDILFDSKVQVHSQTIDDTENPNSPDSYNADAVPESGLSFFKAFRDPFSTDIAPLPAAWVSVSSSLSETEPDVSMRKDFPGIGSGTNFLTRAQFGQPSTSYRFSKLEPLYIHCTNPTLGTKGQWDDMKTCEFETLPNPEILKIENLEYDLSQIKDPPCNLNESPKCEELVLGFSETGEPLKFSNTFKLILNLAGNKFEIEPAAILAYMHRVGADKKYAYYWSEEGEEALKNVTLPWHGSFNFCDDLEPVEQPPHEWKLAWFSERLVSNRSGRPTPSDALKEIAPGREKTASRCNFLDSTYTLASAIAEHISIRENGVLTPLSCAEQSWNNDKYGDAVRSAIKVQYYQIGPLDSHRGTVRDDDTLNTQTYRDIWNACK